ncbi:hypothetical protein VNO80_03169 [Phaseolus coccineus]|uniref:Uncharacterized protein n=1 Tax=Phaseolus coccineus TaxID=3886 RepID=A0AAN9NVI2_PHACN
MIWCIYWYYTMQSAFFNRISVFIYFYYIHVTVVKLMITIYEYWCIQFMCLYISLFHLSLMTILLLAEALRTII